MRIHFGLALAIGLGFTSPAWGQTEAEPFDAAYEAANALAAEGKWAEAAKKFSEAAQLRPTAVTVFNWAQAERNADNISVARAQFARARELAKKEGAEDVVQMSEQALGDLQDKLGRIALVLPPGKNVTVAVDGATVSLTGGQIEVKPGEHRLVVSSPGEPTFVRMVFVRAGQATGVGVHFKEGSQDVGPDVRRVRSTAKRRAKSGPPTVSVILAGVGAAALTGGVVFHIFRDNKLEQAASGCVRTGNGWSCPDNVRFDPSHQDARDAADTALVARNILFGVGAAAVISGATIWLATPDEKVQVGALPLPGGVGANARLRF